MLIVSAVSGAVAGCVYVYNFFTVTPETDLCVATAEAENEYTATPATETDLGVATVATQNESIINTEILIYAGIAIIAVACFTCAYYY